VFIGIGGLFTDLDWIFSWTLVIFFQGFGSDFSLALVVFAWIWIGGFHWFLGFTYWTFVDFSFRI
jgi:hypothetical protein